MSKAGLPIYLDHNASTPVLPEVVDAMLPYLREHFGNPSSTHHYGKAMRAAVERARKQVADLIACQPDEVFFTSGGTEANNLAIRGLAAARPERRHIITSVIEHPATAGPCARLEQCDYSVSRVAVDEVGRVQLAEVSELVSEETLVVTIAHANSETGTIQPIAKIADIAHAAGTLIHSDAAQSCGKITVSTVREKVDLLSIAGHKMYAPHGVGALFVRTGTPIKPVVLGGDHERGLRPGTENVASIVGLGQACEVARRTLVEECGRVRLLRDRLFDLLEDVIPGIRLNGCPHDRLDNTLSVRFPNVSGNALLAACTDIAASTGSACHEGDDSASNVILAMGVPEAEAIGTVRFSLGRSNTRAQIELAALDLIGVWNALY